jgi:hypothetical protein
MQQTPWIINMEEKIGKTVGRRRPSADASAAGLAMQETLLDFLESSGLKANDWLVYLSWDVTMARYGIVVFLKKRRTTRPRVP